MEKLPKKSLFAIALVLSLVTASMIYTFLQSAATKAVSSENEVVLVAKMNIPNRTRIAAEMVQEQRVPREYIQPGAVRELPKAVGTMTREEIVAGEQVLERRLLLPGAKSGFSWVIPPGKRALTVAANEVTGVAGLLKAGDYVDVLVTVEAQTGGGSVTQMAMQNIAVLSVNRDSLAGADNESLAKETAKDLARNKLTSITLAVSPDDAARITLAEEKGKVRFALRPYFQEVAAYTAHPVSSADLVGDRQARQAPQSGPEPSGAPSGRSSQGNTSGIVIIRGTKIQ